jgi:cytochrome bd ubiquinol oxidase subunit II
MHTDPTFLQVLWFVLIGILWAGFFVLEGFDFGVGMLVRVVARPGDEAGKRAIIHTIGPVWDGNEVWLLTAGGATFAAFPNWYASAFSGFYLALFLILAALIVRGVSFEFWGKVDSPRWRTTWELALGISSAAAALLFGVAWANFIHGVPMNASHIVTAKLWDLLHPYALLGGLTTLSLFLTHGANFLSIRTKGELQGRAEELAKRAAPVSAMLMIGFLIWTAADQSFDAPVVVAAIVAGAAVALIPAMQRRSAGSAFATGVVAVLLLVVVLLTALYPNALPSTTNHAYDLTLSAAASHQYTLIVMTVVAVIFTPIVLAYQAWTYWVFRHRLGRDDYEGPLTPLAVFDHRVDGHRSDAQGAVKPRPGPATPA